MKYIITEQQNKLRRRLNQIKDLVELSLIDIYEDSEHNLPSSLQMLILIVSDMVASSIANEANLHGDEFITFRNQTKQYIRNNFYERIKEFWESKQNKSLTTESKIILETFPIELRRRISFDTLKSEIDSIINYEFDTIVICKFKNINDFISEALDFLYERILDDFYDETGIKISPKDKDNFYHYIADNFSKYLFNVHQTKCVKKK